MCQNEGLREKRHISQTVQQQAWPDVHLQQAHPTFLQLPNFTFDILTDSTELHSLPSPQNNLNRDENLTSHPIIILFSLGLFQQNRKQPSIFKCNAIKHLFKICYLVKSEICVDARDLKRRRRSSKGEILSALKKSVKNPFTLFINLDCFFK